MLWCESLVRLQVVCGGYNTIAFYSTLVRCCVDIEAEAALRGDAAALRWPRATPTRVEVPEARQRRAPFERVAGLLANPVPQVVLAIWGLVEDFPRFSMVGHRGLDFNRRHRPRSVVARQHSTLTLVSPGQRDIGALRQHVPRELHHVGCRCVQNFARCKLGHKRRWS